MHNAEVRILAGRTPGAVALVPLFRSPLGSKCEASSLPTRSAPTSSSPAPASVMSGSSNTKSHSSCIRSKPPRRTPVGPGQVTGPTRFTLGCHGRLHDSATKRVLAGRQRVTRPSHWPAHRLQVGAAGKPGDDGRSGVRIPPSAPLRNALSPPNVADFALFAAGQDNEEPTSRPPSAQDRHDWR